MDLKKKDLTHYIFLTRYYNFKNFILPYFEMATLSISICIPIEQYPAIHISK